MPRAYCDDGCRISYRTDVDHGVIFPPVTVLRPDAPPEGPIAPEMVQAVVPWERYAMNARICRYCQCALPEETDGPVVIEGQLELAVNDAMGGS